MSQSREIKLKGQYIKLHSMNGLNQEDILDEFTYDAKYCPNFVGNALK
jgi:hypothetical protein